MRIIFFGTSSFGIPTLEALSRDKRLTVIGVVTTPAKPVGRKQVLEESPVSNAAKKLGLDVYAPLKLSDLKWLETFSGLCPELCVVASYGKILPESNLRIPKYGFLNIHPSLLPRYRGPSPIQGAILGGDRETGVTIMKLDAEMDHGPILAERKIRLTGKEFAVELEGELSEAGASLLLETIPKYINGKIKIQDQDHAEATYTKLISRDEGRVDLKMPADKIERMYRAYHPWPGIWTTIKKNDKEIRVKLLDIELVDGKIKINKLQPEGKKPMSAEEFARGYKGKRLPLS